MNFEQAKKDLKVISIIALVTAFGYPVVFMFLIELAKLVDRMAQ
jgi:hypothetical protein